MDKKIRVLVVDDSAFMRKAIEMMLSGVDDIEVVATARNGLEAIEKVKEFKPDLVTLDIEMPVMDGISALKKIMEENPLPVIMLSSLTTEGTDATMEALEIGAVDFIPKQMSFVSLEIVKIKEDLIRKVRYFAKNKIILMRKIILQRRISRLKKVSRIVKPSTTNQLLNKSNLSTRVPFVKAPTAIITKNKTEIILIGSSTGGPSALQKVIPNLPANLPVPVLVVQHMPPTFTKSLADRLNSLSQVTVKEASNGERVKSGVVYIAPGDKHMIMKSKGIILLTDEPKNSLHKPSVDVMMGAVSEVYGKNIVAVIMTGMGQDGSKALNIMKQKGSIIIGQNEETCVVYGMPKIPNEKGLSNIIVPVEKIAESIVKSL